MGHASFAPAARQIVFTTLLIFVVLIVVGGFFVHGQNFWLQLTWLGISLFSAAGFAIWYTRRALKPFDDRIAALTESMNALSRGERIMVMPVGKDQTEPVLVPLINEFNEMAQAVSRNMHERQSELAHQRTLDPLTGVLNRSALEEGIGIMQASVRGDGVGCTLLYFDVDKFKMVNEAEAFAVGDELLRQIGLRLSESLDPRGLLGRVASDEFAMALQSVAQDEAIRMGEAIRNLVRATPFDVGGRPIHLTVSVGVIAFGRRLDLNIDSDPASVLARGVAAAQTAKELGGNRVYSVHDETSAKRTQFTTRSWVQRINRAIEAGEFTLLFQPIQRLTVSGYATSSGAVEDPQRCEVLLRMNETGGGLALPVAFISVAERYDLMQSIDRWVVSKSIQEWHRATRVMNGKAIAFSVNLSGHSLSSEPFARWLEKQLVDARIPTYGIAFEITETAAITAPEKARELVERLRAKGIKVYLDDFGAGLSSFQYLKHFAVDGIKVDGMFVRGITKSYLDYSLTESIVRVGKNMGLAITAEFVESEEVAKKLHQMGVEFGQGFGVGKPMPFDVAFGVKSLANAK
jgi:diguanylate cyclase (GGDEF)-like protein